MSTNSPLDGIEGTLDSGFGSILLNKQSAESNEGEDDEFTRQVKAILKEGRVPNSNNEALNFDGKSPVFEDSMFTKFSDEKKSSFGDAHGDNATEGGDAFSEFLSNLTKQRFDSPFGMGKSADSEKTKESPEARSSEESIGKISPSATDINSRNQTLKLNLDPRHKTPVRNPLPQPVMTRPLDPMSVSGATRGNRRAVSRVPQSARQSRHASPAHTSATTANTTQPTAPTPLRRVQSAAELRTLAFQMWCEKRGKQYLEEKRNEQRRRQQMAEEEKRQKEEKAKINAEVYAQWIAKKKAQKAATKHQREREAEARRQEEESKRQHKAEAAKVYEAWKSQKEKQLPRRHSMSAADRKRAAEELKKKLEKSMAAHLAFEAWQRQAEQRLQEAREREAEKQREEERHKAEMETMRKALARMSYTQWELKKAFRKNKARSTTGTQPLQAKPPWRPTSARVVIP